MKRRLRATALLLVAAMLVTGCATGDYAYVTRISTGEKIQLPLRNGTPVPPKEGTIEIVYPGISPGVDPANKEMVYLFAFNELSGQPPRSVKVADVTDDEAFVLVEDLAPTLHDQKGWSGRSRPLKAADPAIHWVTYLGDSMRVFQFTIVDSTGKTVVLNQGWFVPGWAKPTMRILVGMDAVK